jgi:hypothetical protein
MPAVLDLLVLFNPLQKLLLLLPPRALKGQVQVAFLSKEVRLVLVLEIPPAREERKREDCPLPHEFTSRMIHRVRVLVRPISLTTRGKSRLKRRKR